MLARRLPVPFSVGTDIVHLPRIRDLITKHNGRYLTLFKRRILRPAEIDDLETRFPASDAAGLDEQGDTSGLVRWLGGRFAAKEAARKAVGATNISWKDISVDIHRASGRPHLLYLLQSTNARKLEQPASLSLSHDGDYVVATVLAPTIAQSG